MKIDLNLFIYLYPVLAACHPGNTGASTAPAHFPTHHTPRVSEAYFGASRGWIRIESISMHLNSSLDIINRIQASFSTDQIANSWGSMPQIQELGAIEPKIVQRRILT